MFPICQAENMRQLLLDRRDTAGIFTADDASDRFRQMGMNLLHSFPAPNDIDGDMRVDVTKHIVVQVDDLIDL